jgi:hypothetical protein
VFVPTPRPLPSPRLAALLAIFPGLGHLYLRQPRKALLFFLGSGALEFFGFDLDLTGLGALLGIPLEVGGLSLYFYSIYDAYHSARALQLKSS